MKLSQVVVRYIAFKESLGMHFRSQAVSLRAFSRYMGDIHIEEVKSQAVLGFIAGKGPITTFWHCKFEILKGLYNFAISRGFCRSSPLPTVIPKRPQPLTPYIYTTKEFSGLLVATETLKTRGSPLQARTFHTLLLLLYGTGLRISEALSLKLADVDLQENLLTITESKFFKSRLVPIGPRLAVTLQFYEPERRRLPLPYGEDSAFLATRRGVALSRQRAEVIFRRLCSQADIHRQDGGRYQPRLHDIRHTFALRRLTAWYREGADVQRLLPRLSTYLGHQNVAATQHYLNMTPDLLNEASRRFEHYVQLEEKYHD